MSGAVWLLVVVCFVTSEPEHFAAPARALFSAPPAAALGANPPTWEDPNAVPVSLLIRNDGQADDRLLGGSTPLAASVGLRRTLLVHGQTSAAPVHGGIAIPAQATVSLEPGKSHLALGGLRTALVQGETFSLTLQFERAGKVMVMARVRRRVDAAGIAPLPEVSVGDLTISLASAPPAPAP